MRFFLSYLSLILFLPGVLWASEPIVLNDEEDATLFTGQYLDYLEDPADELTLFNILHSHRNKFKTGRKGKTITNDNVGSTYWTRLCIDQPVQTGKNWLIELYDFRIDYLELYIPNGKGGFIKYTGGAFFPFASKIYKHKNYLFDLPVYPHQTRMFVYFKIKSNANVSLIGMVRSTQRMIEYSTTEYFLLALFYGVIIVMVIYNLFLFIGTFDQAYLYYVLYILSVGAFALTQDGLGFEFLWPNYPNGNETVPMISAYFVILCALLYAKSFLNTKTFLPILNKGIVLLIVIRSTVLIAGFYFPYIAYHTWFDIFPLVYLYAAGVVSWMKGYRTARYYVLAFTLFFIGFTVTILNNFIGFTDNLYVIYSLNIGVLCEMVMLSFALSDRIKMLTQDKEQAQHDMILQFREKEYLKDQLNKELEEKVKDRTKELEIKNKELDTFVYRSSHDIKGPLKSIIGVTSVGLQIIQDPESRYYFEHILKNSRKLDGVVDHLMDVMQIKDSKLIVSEINFQELISEIILGLKHMPSYPVVKFYLNIPPHLPFFSDKKIVFAVLQIMIENAFKYYDLSKVESFVRIDISVYRHLATIDIADNGIGIDDLAQEKIFDMFYNINSQTTGSGFGLYKTKVYVDKLEGSLLLKSEVGSGSSFSLNLKNHLQPESSENRQ